MRPWRSETHGTCALGGRHADAKMARECPVARQNPAQRATRHGEAPRVRRPRPTVGGNGEMSVDKTGVHLRGRSATAIAVLSVALLASSALAAAGWVPLQAAG